MVYVQRNVVTMHVQSMSMVPRPSGDTLQPLTLVCRASVLLLMVTEAVSGFESQYHGS